MWRVGPFIVKLVLLGHLEVGALIGAMVPSKAVEVAGVEMWQVDVIFCPPGQAKPNQTHQENSPRWHHHLLVSPAPLHKHARIKASEKRIKVKNNCCTQKATRRPPRVLSRESAIRYSIVHFCTVPLKFKLICSPSMASTCDISRCSSCACLPGPVRSDGGSGRANIGPGMHPSSGPVLSPRVWLPRHSYAAGCISHPTSH